jgi:hypothetical protein
LTGVPDLGLVWLVAAVVGLVFVGVLVALHMSLRDTAPVDRPAIILALAALIHAIGDVLRGLGGGRWLGGGDDGPPRDGREP